MMSWIFWVTGAIVWILVIIAVIRMIRSGNQNLYKSNVNKKLCGVCGGLGEYFNIDPTIIRLLWVVIVLCGGSGILAYIIAALVMPKRPDFY